MISEDRQEQAIAPAPSFDTKIVSLNTIESFEARLKYDIQLTKDKYLSLHDFLLSMEFEQAVHALAQKKKRRTWRLYLLLQSSSPIHFRRKKSIKMGIKEKIS